MKTRGLRSQLEETALANYLRLDVPLGDMSLGDMPSDLDDISAMDKYRPGHRALLVSRFCFALTGQTIQPIISPTALRHLHPESLDYVRHGSLAKLTSVPADRSFLTPLEKRNLVAPSYHGYPSGCVRGSRIAAAGNAPQFQGPGPSRQRVGMYVQGANGWLRIRYIGVIRGGPR